jgi:predicted nucleic acid-binding protein
VRFWDSSALVPLFVDEFGTAKVRSWLESDPDVTVWAFTRVEMMSVLARRGRERPNASDEIQSARREIISAWQSWFEVSDVENVRRHALRMVESYPLRAADALQLGAAVVAAEGDPATLDFVTLDRRLANAAEREGFAILGPD